MPTNEAMCKLCSLGGNNMALYEKCIVPGEIVDSGGGCAWGGWLYENFLYLLLILFSVKLKLI